MSSLFKEFRPPTTRNSSSSSWKVETYGKSLYKDRRYAMRCDKVRELGWKPETTLDQGLRKTVEWYVNNEWWWRPLVDEYVLRDEPWRTKASNG